MSALPYNPNQVRQLLPALSSKITKAETSEQANQRLRRLGLSPRQQHLNNLWGWYRCDHYAARRVDWNGKEVLTPIEHEAIATSGFLPAGFYDAGQTLPIKFRKPSAPYALVKVVVDRFTGLLFSEKNHPQLVAEGDEDTNEFVTALVEEARLWPSMIQARTFGGATGTICIGFQFIDGRPLIEVHDPRWVQPQFLDRFSLQLSSIEKRYMYPMDERDPSTGEFATVWHWYRRVIDETRDVLFAPALVGDGEEPQWEVERQIDHNLGFCPVVWAQNLPVQDDIDGDPDCHGIYELAESIDMLLAQSNKGVINNCDPTLKIKTDAEMADVKKGSDNALKLDQAGDASYLEISGTGPEAAVKLADQFRKLALEVAQCVLEHPEMSVRTATEIERLYSTMIAKADVMREQYGQKCVVPLVLMMLEAARKLEQGTVNEETGTIEKQVLNLPPRVRVPGARPEPQKLGAGGTLRIKWPRYFEVTLTDVELASRAATQAKQGGLIDQERAVRFAAEYFRVEDVRDMLARIAQEQEKLRQQLEATTMSALRGGM